MLVTDLYQIFGTYALFGDVAATLVSATLLKELSKITREFSPMFEGQFCTLHCVFIRKRK